MATILDYYKYASLAAASYVQLEGIQLTDGKAVANAANAQRRLPSPIANYLFDADFSDYGSHPIWAVDYYQGNDSGYIWGQTTISFPP
jgi:hypothetical protein